MKLAGADVRDFAQTLALEAAEMLRANATPQNVLFKAPGDWFSQLDIQVENHLRARIAQRYPDHGFLGEESAAAEVTDGLLWLVDPIDGSMNFLRGYPQYSVSVALLYQQEPIAACIVDPCRGEVFSAAAGQGATLNGRRLQVAATASLQNSVAATVFPKPGAAFMTNYLAQFTKVLAQVAGVRRAGSMALEMAYLAAGRVDAFWEQGMGSWDAAAGVLLIREAGGEVFTIDELPWCESQQVAAAAPGVARAWKQLLSELGT